MKEPGIVAIPSGGTDPNDVHYTTENNYSEMGYILHR